MNVAVERSKDAQRARRPTATRFTWLCIAVFQLSGCAQDTLEIPLPTAAEADLQDFTNTAYPVLLRDCGFPQCHGSEQRFFQVFGPGRVRIGPPPFDVDPSDTRYPEDPDNKEHRVSYERARSMLTRTNVGEDFFLLRKALDVGVGGAGHKGSDRLGRNVYRSRQDPAWLALQRWALSSAMVAQ